MPGALTWDPTPAGGEQSTFRGGLNSSADGATATLQALAAGAGKTVAFFGDSITDSAGQVSLYGFRITSTVNGFVSANWVIQYADPETPAGTGSWTYDSVAKTCTWAAPGESAGAAVDVSRSGVFYLSSSVAGHGLVVVFDASNTTYTTGTTQVTIPADGNQYQALFSSRGYAPCSLMIAGPSFDFARTTIYRSGIALGGVPGMNTATLASSAWQTNQITADFDVIEIGTNDTATLSATGSVAAGQIASIITNLTTFIQSRVTLGTRNIGVMTIPPRAAFTASQNKGRNQINRWIKDYCSSIKRLHCLDVAAAISDPSTGAWATGYAAADGIHPANIGAWAMAQVVANWLTAIAPKTPYLPDFNDVYDANYNPYGAWVAGTGYLSFEGTGGAGVVTGVIPANYNTSRQSGSTTIAAVGSKVARTDNVPGNWYQLAITGAASESLRLTPQSNAITLSTLGVSPGDKMEGFLEVNIPASSGMRFCDFSVSWTGPAARAVNAFTDVIIGGNALLTDNMGRFWLRLPPTTVPVGATAVSVNIRMGADTSATVQLGRWWLSKARTV